jgi:antitoxin VapB
MAFHIRDSETDRLARELAEIQRGGITEAVKSALVTKLAEERRKIPLMERIKDITEEIAAAPKTGLKADKAYFDEMWGQGDD